MSVLLEDFVPVVKYEGLNTNKNVDFSGATTVALPAGTTIAGTTAAGTSTITSSSANALTVGPNGATNPALKVDASVGSLAAGLSLTGATAAGNVALAVISSGNDANLLVNAKGTGTIGIGTVSTGAISLGAATTITGATGVTGAVTVTSASALSLAVGRLGATTPAFVVDSATGTQVTGLSVTGAATGGTVAVAVIQTAGNANLTINAKGSGTLGLATASTGITTVNRGVLKALVVGELLTAAGATQNSTPTAAQLLGGIFTHQSQTAGGTCTLDTGTNISTAVTGVTVGDTFNCLYANVGNQTVTLTGASGSTVIGTASVLAGANALMIFINTGSNAWSVYTLTA